MEKGNLTFRLDLAVERRVKELADAERRTVADQARLLMESGLEELGQLFAGSEGRERAARRCAGSGERLEADYGKEGENGLKKASLPLNFFDVDDRRTWLVHLWDDPEYVPPTASVKTYRLLLDQESTLLRLFSRLDGVAQASVIVHAAGLLAGNEPAAT